MELLRDYIRDVLDFPKPGIVFKDITPLLENPEKFRLAVQTMAGHVPRSLVTKIVCIESRGFLFGSAIAYDIGVGLVPVRKPNKLPYKTKKVSYQLEYGTDSLEMHIDALTRDDRVVIVDDVLATGGTARATAKLVEDMGAKVESLIFLLELGFLDGRSKLRDYRTVSLLTL